MFVSGADIDAGSTLQGDLVIVGAGAAGIAMAHRLIGAPLRVILLESGGLEFEEPVQDLYRGAVVGQPTEDLDISRLRYFGGTTNHWAGWCRPLDREDFEARSDWPEAGWPIARDDLDAYYPDAAGLCQLGPAGFDDLEFWRRRPAGQELRALDLDSDRLRTALFQVSPPTRFAETYGPALRAAANVQVVLNANVIELLPTPTAAPDADLKSIGGVAVASAPERQFTVTGRAVVVAIGGIETPRLLLSSTRVHAAGAGNERDLVGRYFMDHPWLVQQAYWRFSREGSNWPLYFSETEIDGVHLFGTLAPNRDWARERGIGGFRLFLQGSTASTAGNESLREIVGALRQGRLADDFGDHVGNIVNDIDVVADSAYKTVTGSRDSPFHTSPGPGAPLKGAQVDLNFEQRPNPDSRVTLGEDRDAYGMRRVRLDWRLGDSERRTAAEALALLAQQIGAADLGRVRIKLDLADGKAWPGEMMGSRHHMGTARMSATPRTGVVDRDCRVHGTANLFIAGSAVFATCGYANPTLTIVALALRLAEHLRKELV